MTTNKLSGNSKEHYDELANSLVQLLKRSLYESCSKSITYYEKHNRTFEKEFFKGYLELFEKELASQDN